MIWNFPALVNFVTTCSDNELCSPPAAPKWGWTVDEDRTALISAVPVEVLDAIRVGKMADPYLWDRRDWLAGLDKVSEGNRQEALHQVVALRRKRDQGVPIWLILAVQACQKYGWQVPGEWAGDLEAATRVIYWRDQCRSLKEEAENWLKSLAQAG